MKKTLFSVLLIIAMLLNVFPVTAFANDKFLVNFERADEIPEGYTGIYSAEDLASISKNLAGNYMLMEDITITNWTPIGTYTTPFSGVFDGNGHTITFDISYSLPYEYTIYVGVFGVIENGTVKNLRTAGTVSIWSNTPTITSPTSNKLYVGSVCAIIDTQAHITNCINTTVFNVAAASKRLVGKNAIGGIIGIVNNGANVAITYCKNYGKIYSTTDKISYADNVGGIVGEFRVVGGNSIIHACENNANINARASVGGILGSCMANSSSSTLNISACANNGKITSSNFGAGIAGMGGYASFSNCINTASVVTLANEITFVGGMSSSNAKSIKNCINTGAAWFSMMVASNSTPDIENCYWLGTGNTCLFCVYFDGSDLTTGKLTEEQIKIKESYEGLDFEKDWFFIDGMDYPYPVELFGIDYYNAYKFSFVELASKNHNDNSELIYVLGSSEGGMAGAMGKAYRDAGLHLVNNVGWDAINYLKDILHLDFVIENDYDIILADLLTNSLKPDDFLKAVNDSFLDNLSEAVGLLSVCFDAYDVSEMIQSLEKLGKLDTVYCTEGSDYIAKVFGILEKALGEKTIDVGLTIAGSAIDLTIQKGQFYSDIEAQIKEYVLCNAFVDAVDKYCLVLEKTAEQTYNMEEQGFMAKNMRSAISKYTEKLKAYAKENKMALVTEFADDICSFAAPACSALIDVFLKLANVNTVWGSLKSVITLGVSLADSETNMNDIAYYGKLINLSGYMAECMFATISNCRKALNENPDDYEAAALLECASEVYITLQILACDYAMGYNNAIISSNIGKGFPPSILDEAKSNAQLEIYKKKLLKIKNEATDIEVGFDGTICGYVVSCPVTVIVQDTKTGKEVARSETGNIYVAPENDNTYSLLGVDKSQKCGFYDPKQHSLRIVGEGTGEMNIALYTYENGNTACQIYKNLKVEADCLYTYENGKLFFNGKAVELYTEATEVKGDVNGDGYADNTDALLILKYDAGIIDLTDHEISIGDVNGDGYADNTDALFILKYDAGIIDTL